MLQTYKSYTRRTLAMLLAVLVAVGALFSGSFPVHAADGTISYKAGANIPYGSYFTSRMSFDGSNTAYCVEPLKKTPSSGSYSYDLPGIHRSGTGQPDHCRKLVSGSKRLDRTEKIFCQRKRIGRESELQLKGCCVWDLSG